jgi:hypothetical protein
MEDNTAESQYDRRIEIALPATAKKRKLSKIITVSDNFDIDEIDYKV